MRRPHHTIICLTATSLFAYRAVLAQECEALLAHGLRNVTHVVSTDVFSRVDYAQDCGSDFSLKSDQAIASLAVRVGIFDSQGSARFNRTQVEQQLKDWCRTNASNLHTNAYNVTESSQLADFAVRAWSECVALERQDVRIYPAITPDAQTVTLSVQYVGSGRVGPQFLGAAADGYQLQSVSGPASVRTKALNNLPFTLPRNAVVALRYQRAGARDTTVGGAVYTYYPRGSIDVSAATQSVQLYFPAEWTPSLPQQAAVTLAQQIGALAHQVTTLQREAPPVGTFIASVLAPDKFFETVDRAAWVPAEGGLAPAGSRYKQVVGDTLPDLRGLFVRGLNTFTPGASRADGHQDPDQRTVLSIQGPAVQDHTHRFEHIDEMSFDGLGQGSRLRIVADDGPPWKGRTWPTTTVCTSCGPETRPRNVAVYYYVRIN